MLKNINLFFSRNHTVSRDSGSDHRNKFVNPTNSKKRTRRFNMGHVEE